MPDSGYALKFIDFVAAVEKLYRLHGGYAVGIFQLFRFELVVILPGFEKRLEEGAVRDADLRADFEFRYVDPFSFTHRLWTRFRSMWRAFSIVPIPGPQRQLFPHWEGRILQGAGNRVPDCQGR